VTTDILQSQQIENAIQFTHLIAEQQR